MIEVNVKKSDKTFEELVGIAIPQTSYMRLFNVLKDQSVQKGITIDDFVSEYFFNIWKTVDINEKIFKNPANTTFQEMLPEDKWDLLANKYYGDRSLWWVIAVANNINDASFYVKEGLQLRIPSNLSQILNDLEKINK